MIRRCWRGVAVALTLPLLAPMASAQEAALPGMARGEELAQSFQTVRSKGLLREIRWDEGNGQVFFRTNDGWKSVPIAGGDAAAVEEADVPELGEQPSPKPGAKRGGSRGPAARGRQSDREGSPDGEWTAVSEGGNVRLEREDAQPRDITTDATATRRFGTACWVYGEELDQATAMWWSPDSKSLAFYSFDESEVPPYYLTGGNTALHTTILTERYPKPGEPNPKVGLIVYDLDTRVSTPVDVGDWEYVFRIRFSPDGSDLLFQRTNRHQNVLELCAWNLASRQTRVVLTESQPCWQANSPEMRFLADGRRFIWMSESTGWPHYTLHSLDGAAPLTLSRGEFPCTGIVRVDETAGWLYFTANSSATQVNQQYLRAKLDGSAQEALTRADRFHSDLRMSPSGTHFVCVDETVAEPPATRLYRADGTQVDTLAEGESDPWTGHGLQAPQLVKCLAADGLTPLWAIVWKPSQFTTDRQWPMVVHVYGGPGFPSISGRFSSPDPVCEMGFVTMRAQNRGIPGRGKAFETGTYLKLGVVDMDDQAAAAAEVARQSSVDPTRIGIMGSSYGGYLSALAVIRHPEVFHAGVAEAAVTDWRNYDSIYTERYMRTPEENAGGYDEGSCVKHAADLGGKLLIIHGLGDDNVHPANAWQLANELQKANLDFEMMIFPTAGHGAHGEFAEELRWGFLIRELGAAP